MYIKVFLPSQKKKTLLSQANWLCFLVSTFFCLTPNHCHEISYKIQDVNLPEDKVALSYAISLIPFTFSPSPC